MKAFVLESLSIILMSIFFCPIVMAAPPMPNDVQMVEADPSLPKEIAVFWGKWEGRDQNMQFFLIVEKIDEGKASLYSWVSGNEFVPEGWRRYEAKVIKEYGKYKLWARSPTGNLEYTSKGKYLECSHAYGSYRLTRVP